MNNSLTANPISKYHVEQQLTVAVPSSQYRLKAIQILDNYQFIEHLGAADKQQLMQCMKIKKLYHNQLLYKQNDPGDTVNIILEGALKLGWTLPSGRPHTELLIPSGTLINIVSAVTEQPLIHDHIAQGITVLANIPAEIFIRSICNNADSLFKILQLICIRTQLKREHRFYAAAESLATRLAKELLFLVDYHSYQSHNKILFKIKLNQANIAELLQTTRQNINRELAFFYQEGILCFKYNKIEILDYEKLKAVASNDGLATTARFL
jgi:CRP/FNR family cyclic AMP-dependent transcriptional regulator